MTSLGRLLVRGASGSFATRVVGTGLAFGTHALLARLLGAESYGHYFFSLSAISILALAGKFGLDIATLRYVPAYSARQEWGLLRGFFRKVGRISWVNSAVLSLLLAAIVWFGGYRLDPELRHVLLVSCLALPVTVIIQVRSAGVQAFKHVVLAQIPSEVVRYAALTVIMVVAVLGIGLAPTAPLAMGAEVVALCVGILLAERFLRDKLPIQAKGVEPRFHTREWVRTALPLSLVGGLLVTLNQSQTLLVGALLGTKESGIFGVAAGVATLVGFGLRAANSIVAPMISELYWQGKTGDLQRMLSLAAMGLVAFSVPLSLGIIIFGKFILSLFGPAFTAGYATLVVLTLAQLIHSLAGPTGFLMTMTGYQGQAARIIFAAVALMTGLGLVLIPKLGIEGAALSMAGAIVFWNVWMYLLIRRELDVDPTLLSLLKRTR
jgi:O-antigen/teichoic acid export membrane protein